MADGPLDSDQVTPNELVHGPVEWSSAISREKFTLDYLKERFQTWREAWTDWTTHAPIYAILAPPRPIFIWAIESGELDTDVGGADDPADQVYFAVRDGLIKIGFSGSPRRRLSSACTVTRTIRGGSLQEAMLHNLFDDTHVWRDDRPERSSAEWYKPTPLLVRLANAEVTLHHETTDAATRQLLAKFWRERHSDGIRGVATPADPTE